MKVDLDKMYLPVKVGGLTFRNPFYVGSGPTTKSVDHLIKAAENGWAGASIKLTFDPEPYVSLEPRYGWFDDQGILSFSAETRLTVNGDLSLTEAREHYAQCGAAHPRFLPYVRKPQVTEQ